MRRYFYPLALQEIFFVARIKKKSSYFDVAGDEMINGVIFDIDGTLYSYIENHARALKILCKFTEKNLGVGEEEFLKVYCEAREIIKSRLTDGGALHSRALFFQTALEILGKNPFRYMLKMYKVYWNSFLSEMKPFDGAGEFVRKLKNSGKKISVCTDMTAHIQYRKIERLGLNNFIDFMVSSEETGLEKPSPKMFNLALKKMNLPPEEVAYFGDSPDRDIEGAASVGIKPFWFLGEHPETEIKVDCIKFKNYSEVVNSKIFF